MTDRKFVAGLEKAMKVVQESYALRGGTTEMVLAPTCRIDLQTYSLMSNQASWGKYAEYLSSALKRVRPWIDDEKIRMTSTMVKSQRGEGKVHLLRVRISTEDLAWVMDVAKRCELKPRAVLESVLYLYARAVA